MNRIAPLFLLLVALLTVLRPALADSASSAPEAPACATVVERAAPGLYRTDAAEAGHVALTFDDGPHPKHTPRVLDLLAELRMPATFFVVGRNISRETYPLVQRVVAEGHVLGSHSYSHDVKMTQVGAPQKSHDDILAQHATTAILIDIALMARSGDDFDSMFDRVFQQDPAKWLTSSTLRVAWKEYAARHADLLVSRGYQNGARPYHVVFSRPPGGGPYVEHDGAQGMKIHDAALAELGMLNVMWHSASGDTVPEKRADYAFLTDNMKKGAAHGGVILIHDYMRADALDHALRAMAASGVEVVTLEQQIQDKYRCPGADLSASL